MPGVRADQVAAFKKDMYMFEKEGMAEVKPKYGEIYRVIPNATGAGTKITQRLKSADFKRHTSENQDIDFRAPTQGWTSYAKYWRFSDGLSFSKEAMEDDMKLGNLLRGYAKDWGEAAAELKEEIAARPFNEGGNLSGDWIFNGSYTGEDDSSGDLPYDSKPLFNLTGNTRTTKGGQTYYNSFAGYTMIPSNFETIYNHHTATNNRDEVGSIKANPADTILCLPGADYLAAKRITKSENLPTSSMNDMNPYADLIDKVIKWDYLDSAESAYFVGKRQHKTWEFHERQDQETDFFLDHNNRGSKASVDIRMGILFKPGAWKAWTRGGGTSA
jgi:hypothetical protein